jgi:sulfotransferase family protein
MTLRIVGAGLGRTGTTSLKAALERLLGGPCHHMMEVFAHPEQIPAWHAAARADMPDWHALLRDYRATVDWPSAAFWPEISAAFPDAVILLSVRDPASWWKSASSTIFTTIARAPEPWRAMVMEMMRARFTPKLDDRDACLAAYDRWYADARARIPRDRLLEWRASDGWKPICERLGVAIPDEPFPHANKTEDFQAMVRGMQAATNTGGGHGPAGQ